MRAYPYIIRKPESYDTTIQGLINGRFFVVNRPGPTVFIIKDGTNENDDALFKVIIGAFQSCTCGGGLYYELRSHADKDKSICAHIAFVMTKVLKVSTSNPLVWQLSLTDIELSEILSGRHLSKSKRSKKKSVRELITGQTTVKLNDSNQVTRQRKTLDDDRSCAVCQEEMTDNELLSRKLCFCKDGCASNFHVNCMIMVKAYADASKKPFLCPLCRECFGQIVPVSFANGFESDIIRSTNPSNETKDTSYFTRCSSCQTKIKGNSDIYRCLNCDSHEYCKRCFIPLRLANHTFVRATCSDYPNLNWSVPTTSTRVCYKPEFSNIQHREFVSQDYDLLLSLDEKNTPLLHVHLASALPNSNIHSKPCCVCRRDVLKVSNMGVKQLPCMNHIAHEPCIISMIMEAFSSGERAEEICCPVCKSELFVSLKKPLLLLSTKTFETSDTYKKNEILVDNSKSADTLLKGIIGNKLFVSNMCNLNDNTKYHTMVKDRMAKSNLFNKSLPYFASYSPKNLMIKNGIGVVSNRRLSGTIKSNNLSSKDHLKLHEHQSQTSQNKNLESSLDISLKNCVVSLQRRDFKKYSSM